MKRVNQNISTISHKPNSAASIGSLINKILKILFIIITSSSELVSDDESMYVYFSGHPDYAKSDIESVLAFWMKEIGKDYVKKVEIKCRILSDYQEVLKQKQIHKNVLYGTPTIEYLILKDKFPVEPIGITNLNVADGDEAEKYVIVTLKKSNIKSLSDFKNINISLSKEYNKKLTFYYWINSIFKKLTASPFESTTKQIKYCENHKDALMELFFGKSDACILNKSVFTTMKRLNPQIDKKLATIIESEEFTSSVIFVSQSCDIKLRTFILSKLLSLDSYDKGKQLKNVFKFNEIKLFDDKLISTTENVYYEAENQSKKKK